jgi:PIN domain nuclease of toxin-antitoxin system
MVKSAIRDVWDEGKARMVGAASYWEVAGKSHKRMIGKLRLYGLYRKSRHSAGHR